MTPNTPAGGAVAWQERPAGDGFEMTWMNCSREEYERLKGSPLYVTRALYTQPPDTVPLDAAREISARLLGKTSQLHRMFCRELEALTRGEGNG